MSAVARHLPVGRLGQLEVVIGLTIFDTIGFGGGSQLHRLALAPTINGIIFTSLSGVAGLLGFGAAYLLRIKRLAAFVIR